MPKFQSAPTPAPAPEPDTSEASTTPPTNPPGTNPPPKVERKIDPAIAKLREEHKARVAALKQEQQSGAHLANIVQKLIPKMTRVDLAKLFHHLQSLNRAPQGAKQVIGNPQITTPENVPPYAAN